MKKLQTELSTIKRWLIFNSVGAMGILVQMAVLLFMTSIAGIHYMVATGVAVEIAVIHNFLWHERWTWADRTGNSHKDVWWRLLRFHLANGAISLLGNLALMKLFVEIYGLNFLWANGLAISLCSILNYVSGDLLVFRFNGHQEKGRMEMIKKTCSMNFQRLYLIIIAALCGATALQAADLQPETVKAWSACVEKTERRRASEFASTKGFLAIDFQDQAEADRDKKKLLSGKVVIQQINDGRDCGRDIDIPDGMLHHWIGSIFIPGVTLDSVFSRVENPRPEDTRQEDVLESSVLEKNPGQLRMYLKLQRSKIITVRYNTEHLVHYQRNGSNQASSSSVATKIAEIEKLHGNNEREKPVGRDSGYLWRMNSYWRYQQVEGGVIVECESMTLSRSIPIILEYMIHPIIKSIARESMSRTLESMRTRLEHKTSPLKPDVAFLGN
jgi:putative flippase GtrA